MAEIVIIGAGMAGYGASSRLGQEDLKYSLFEKNNYIGGHCTTFHFKDGWTFDDGPHISFTKNERIRELFYNNTNKDVYETRTRVNNYWKGQWIKHPAQVNLYGISPDLNTRILLEMINLPEKDNNEITNYKEWLYASFGETFAENFPMKYTRKYHTTDASNMSTDWLGPRLYLPKLEEVIFGMLSSSTQDVHYINNLLYPKHGGFVKFMDGFQNNENLRLNHTLTSIDLKTRELTFNENSTKVYDYLISSVPLNSLVNLIKDTPAEIKMAAEMLACTQCVIVNIGVEKEIITDQHWTYFYDEDINIVRLSSPSNFSKNNAPEGFSSIQAEIYFSDKYKPLTHSHEHYIDVVTEELKKCNLIGQDDKIVHQSSWVIPYAQIIFDHDRAGSVRLIKQFLKEHNIYPCGRYGDWSYAWSDESFISGEYAAEEIIQQF
jgi:protoporphyrinogen oxidase